MATKTRLDIFEGDTVAQAIQLGLAELDINQSEADIVVIQNESTKYWGVKKQKAKVKITKKQRDNWEDWILDKVGVGSGEVDPIKRETHTHLTGRVWIKDGHIQFQASPTVKPILVVPDEITVYKNDKQVKGRTALTEGDRITFDLSPTAVETTWSVRLDEAKQQVSLRVNPGKYYIPSLKDELPTHTLNLSIHQNEQVNNQLSENDVCKQLDLMGIVHGINHDAIKQACAATLSLTIVIAEGEQPKHGKDGDVTFLIDMSERSLPFLENTDGTADFRESSYIPSLKEGEVLGTVVEPTKGEDGRSLYGDVLKASDGHPVIVKPGNGVEFVDQEQKVVTTQSGRPHIERLGRTVKISIMPKLTHRGDVEVSSGNIHFIGDVEVLGSINEDMLVHAEGQVAIYRHVMQGIIQAKSDITINGNVIRGSLVAGKDNSSYAELNKQLQPFVDHYVLCLQSIKQLAKNQKFIEIMKQHGSLNPVIKLLLESSNKKLLHSSAKLVGTIYSLEHKIDKRWKTFANQIEMGLLKFHSKGFQTIQEMEELHQEAAALLDYISVPSQSSAHVKINYAMNSTITARGDVIILGKGSIHTNVEAGGKIKVNGKAIGGRLIGKKGVELEQAGSPAGVPTIVQTDDEGVIEIATCHPDVVIIVGKHTFKIVKEEVNIRARLNTQGELVLYR
ncbi:FapA family protein [Paenalkalicoccus suaedae]|uniref:FapA family protein n=1 Tax=Paenalkalicoccus suaedae TaxID=2592382 RepID=A0A859FH63_9BACI|nr:FapA family protein [Paenalkalicoccus suaedae]QKS72703.1 FapA family protein [Paenalkalicoccus suaedae]